MRDLVQIRLLLLPEAHGAIQTHMFVQSPVEAIHSLLVHSHREGFAVEVQEQLFNEAIVIRVEKVHGACQNLRHVVGELNNCIFLRHRGIKTEERADIIIIAKFLLPGL